MRVLIVAVAVVALAIGANADVRSWINDRVAANKDILAPKRHHGLHGKKHSQPARVIGSHGPSEGPYVCLDHCTCANHFGGNSYCDLDIAKHNARVADTYEPGYNENSPKEGECKWPCYVCRNYGHAIDDHCPNCPIDTNHCAAVCSTDASCLGGGLFCETCNYQGQCINHQPTGYECVCNLGWKGPNCMDEALCDHNPCKNGGACTEIDHSNDPADNEFECDCVPGWFGDTCEIPGCEDRCGGQHESYKCWCDDLCREQEDCCADYNEQCVGNVACPLIVDATHVNLATVNGRYDPVAEDAIVEVGQTLSLSGLMLERPIYSCISGACSKIDTDFRVFLYWDDDVKNESLPLEDQVEQRGRWEIATVIVTFGTTNLEILAYATSPVFTADAIPTGNWTVWTTEFERWVHEPLMTVECVECYDVDYDPVGHGPCSTYAEFEENFGKCFEHGVSDLCCETCPQDYDVRLIVPTGGLSDTPHPYPTTSLEEGILEVYYNNEWGTVCDNEWGVISSGVVCRQLGYTDNRGDYDKTHADDGKTHIGLVPAVDIILDHVMCDGSEWEIGDCALFTAESAPTQVWGTTIGCDHTKDIYVSCLPKAYNPAGQITIIDAIYGLNCPTSFIDGSSTIEAFCATDDPGIVDVAAGDCIYTIVPQTIGNLLNSACPDRDYTLRYVCNANDGNAEAYTEVHVSEPSANGVITLDCP